MRHAMLRRIRGVQFQRDAASRLDLSVLDLHFAEVVLGRYISTTAKHRYLRAVQTCLHLWLVLCDDACGASRGLAMPPDPGPQPPWWRISRQGFSPVLESADSHPEGRAA